MSAEWLITNFLSAWLLPPLDLIAVIALGLALAPRRPRLGLTIAASSLALLAVLCTPVAGHLLISTLESYPPLKSSEISESGAGAIVVLGSGRRVAPEYGGDTVSDGGLVRIRYGARLARETRLPVLVTGGKPTGGSISEAEVMAEALDRDFGVKARWLETASINTIQNAQFSAKILAEAGIKRVILVTDASHMRRSVARFRSVHIDVVPAPTAFHIRSEFTLLDYLPSTRGLFLSNRALHEWVGILVSRARGV